MRKAQKPTPKGGSSFILLELQMEYVNEIFFNVFVLQIYRTGVRARGRKQAEDEQGERKERKDRVEREGRKWKLWEAFRWKTLSSPSRPKSIS